MVVHTLGECCISTSAIVFGAFIDIGAGSFGITCVSSVADTFTVLTHRMDSTFYKLAGRDLSTCTIRVGHEAIVASACGWPILLVCAGTVFATSTIVFGAFIDVSTGRDGTCVVGTGIECRVATSPVVFGAFINIFT